MTILVCILSGCDSYDTNHVNSNVDIEEYDNIIVYYPQYKTIDFCVEGYPSKKDSTIVFCCGASFTGRRKFTRDFNNVAGPYVTKDGYHSGYDYDYNTCAFVYCNNRWRFVIDSLDHYLYDCSNNNGAGFTQMPIIINHQNIHRPEAENYILLGNFRLYKSEKGELLFRRRKHKYRALCEKDDRICVIELKKKDTYDVFSHELMRHNVKNALYLDAGFGWSYGWYRDNRNHITDLDTYIHPFISNWLVFRK